MPTLSVSANVTIDGTDTSYVQKISRENNLCHIGQVATIDYAPEFDHSSVLPWQTVTIVESGELVFSGYVEEIVATNPLNNSQIICKDTYKRAEDWFIDDQIEANGETIGYWVDYFCNLCGLTYVITAPGSDFTVGQDPFGMRYVADVLLSLAAMAGWQMRMRVDGTLEFLILAGDFCSAENAFIGNFYKKEIRRSDADSRNVVKIFGYDVESGGPIMLTKRREIPGIDVDKIMVFGSPAIDNLTKANFVADAALRQYGQVMEEGHATIELFADPTVQPGDFTKFSSLALSTSAAITSVKTTLDESGYYADIITGMPCPRLPEFPVGEGAPVEGDNFPPFCIYVPGHSGTAGWIQDNDFTSGVDQALGLDIDDVGNLYQTGRTGSRPADSDFRLLRTLKVPGAPTAVYATGAGGLPFQGFSRATVSSGSDIVIGGNVNGLGIGQSRWFFDHIEGIGMTRINSLTSTVVASSSSSTGVQAMALGPHADEFMAVGGQGGGPTQWRTEIRKIADLSLVAATQYPIVGLGGNDEIPYSIALGNSFYVMAGNDSEGANTHWHIEKRAYDFTLDWAYTGPVGAAYGIGIRGNRIYAGGASAGSGLIIALDCDTGALLWSMTTPYPIDDFGISSCGLFISSRDSSGSGYMARYDFDGNPLWSFRKRSISRIRMKVDDTGAYFGGDDDVLFSSRYWWSARVLL